MNFSFVFSIKNCDVRKVITIFGIKFKIKSKILVLENKLNNLIKTSALSNAFIDEILMKKHLQKINSQVKLSRNGLISYSYNNNEYDPQYYLNQKSSGNIGDYVQSCAGKQFIDNVDEYIDRDLLGSYDKEPVNLIMNAWWYIWYKNYKFSDKINPLFVGFHINNPQNVKDETLKYLKQHEPIGCRDYQTRDFLFNNGIEAYFSGCLTLTLGNKFKSDENERENKVYLVDCQKGRDKYIDKEIKKILKLYNNCEVQNITHFRDVNISVEDNLNYAEDLLKKYSKAKLVITERLHCALPCLAVGTPVIFIVHNYDKMRYRGLVELLNVIGVDDSGNHITKINTSETQHVYNSDNYKKYSDFLTQICTSFMS